jgi:hypothetical protein
VGYDFGEQSIARLDDLLYRADLTAGADFWLSSVKRRNAIKVEDFIWKFCRINRPAFFG